jgi:hypothetical protein
LTARPGCGKVSIGLSKQQEKAPVHPIHYSLIYNIIALLVAAGLAFHFAQPMLVLVVLILAQHSMGRFSNQDDDDDDDEGPGMGFLSKP